MAWTLNSIQIITQDFDEDTKNILARIQPLSGGTVLHKFGYESTVYSINAIVVGTTDKNALIALSKTNTAYTLVTPNGNISNVYVNAVKAKQRLGVISQTLRTDLDCDSPVFDVNIELFVEG